MSNDRFKLKETQAISAVFYDPEIQHPLKEKLMDRDRILERFKDFEGEPMEEFTANAEFFTSTMSEILEAAIANYKKIHRTTSTVEKIIAQLNAGEEINEDYLSLLMDNLSQTNLDLELLIKGNQALVDMLK